MSRLRARTWTALERRVMWLWALRKGVTLPHKWQSDGTDYAYQMAFRFNTKLAERIVRTKGVDLHRARIRARGDVETHIDPVTGRTLSDLLETEFARDYVRNVSLGAWHVAWGRRVRISRYANRKYPLKRPVPVSRVIVSSPDVEAWFILGWVQSGSNPNIYVRREE